MRVTNVATTPSVRSVRADAADGRACRALLARRGRRARRRLPALPGDGRSTPAGSRKARRRRRPINGERRRRRKRSFGRLLGLTRAARRGAARAQEPILRRLSDEEVALSRRPTSSTASAYRRTVGGIVEEPRRAAGEHRPALRHVGRARSHGRVGSLVVPVPRQPRSGQPIRLERRGHELDELEPVFKDWNAKVEDEGRLVPEIARLLMLPTPEREEDIRFAEDAV